MSTPEITPEECSYAIDHLNKTIYENPFIPTSETLPSKKQIEFLLYQGQEALFGGSAGGGKALQISTPIPTPSGWTTMGELQAGDFVFGMNGKPTQIVATTDVMLNHKCWELTFDDGSTIVADGSHLWLTFDYKELSQLTKLNPEWRAKRRARRKSRSCVGAGTKLNHTEEHRQFLSRAITERNRLTASPRVAPPKGTVRTTSEIAATIKTAHGWTNHAVPVGCFVDLPDVELPIDPYIFGLWLGDGNSNNSGFTTSDEELIDSIRLAGWNAAKAFGPYHWTIGTTKTGPRAGNRGNGLVNDFSATLRSMGVAGNKHVPMSYMRASRSQRLALLQGLMDTDGTVAKSSGSAEFTNTNQRIAEAVCELACSLGHKASIREGVAKLNGRIIGPKWTVKWVAPEIVFRLARKASLQKIATRRTTKFRYIVKCEPVASVPVKCIQVAATDGMFLAGKSFIPTHNSVALLMAALQYVTVPGYSALLIRRTYRHLMQDGGLIQLSKRWIGDKATFKEKSMQWTFPSGATLTFGYLDHYDDTMLYQGGNWQFIGTDELSQLGSNRYLYMFSRLRKPDWVCKTCQLPLVRHMTDGWRHKTLSNCPLAEPIFHPCDSNGIALPDVPLRVRAASNPGGPSHEFVKRRFVVEGAPKHFVSSRLDDNPGLNKEEYVKSLSELDPITRAQLLQGDWNAYEGGRFKRQWFREFWVENNRYGDPVYKWSATDVNGKTHSGWPTCPVEGVPVSMCWNFITCDPAARAEDANDYTAIGVFAVMPTGEMLILEIVRSRLDLEMIVPRIGKLCEDYSPMFVGIEDVAFQLGIVREGQRTLGVAIQRLSPEGKSKLVRATPSIIRASEGQIMIPKDEPKGKFPWLEDFVSELIQWTGDEKQDPHDDQVDVLAMAAISLGKHGLAVPIVIEPENEYETNERPLGIFMSNYGGTERWN